MNKYLIALLLVAAPVSAQLAPSDWYKIGKPFGPAQSWQFGLDKSATAGACVGYNFGDKEVLVGTCREFLLLARRGQPFAHVGAALMWDSSHAHSAFVGRAGLHAGQALGAFSDKLTEDFPRLTEATGWKQPAWLAYVDKITAVDAFGGPRSNPLPDQHPWVYGLEVKATVPFEDLLALFKKPAS